MAQLSERRSQTAGRIEELRAELTNAETIASGKACVYMTGSFGRGEASKYSDLDLFIAGRGNGKRTREGRPASELSNLDEICIKADLIRTTRKLGIKEFSGDGQWLAHYSVDELVETLGTPNDDAQNTFTARLLLLLESQALLGSAVYRQILDDVIAKYWRDYEDHSTNFMPAFLANDILRLWRTFCVNYEAKTERGPEREKAKGKIKNYKLKHSRLLTCYSAILYLIAVYAANGTVQPDDARNMIAFTPTARLEWLARQPHLSDAKSVIGDCLAKYDDFLEVTNTQEDELDQNFMDDDMSKGLTEAAYQFGDRVFDALACIGKGSRFHRILVV